VASLEKRQAGVYRIRFRFGGRQWYRSLETASETEASQIKSRVERTLLLLKSGDLSLPTDPTPEQVWQFLRTGGRTFATYDADEGIRLGDAVDRYFTDIPAGAKEASSLATERIHANHLKRILGPRTPLQAIGVEQLQRYVKDRCTSVAPYTCRKELGTLGQIWSYAHDRDWVRQDYPNATLRFPKSPEAPPFQTYEQIESAIADGAGADLWDALFLREQEVLDVLHYARENASHPVVVPMLALAAVGLRRSEILRSEVNDLDLERGIVLVREKKRVRSASLSFRRVDLPLQPAPFVQIIQDWLSQHPGGKYTICTTPGQPLNVYSARGYMQRTLRTEPREPKPRKAQPRRLTTKGRPDKRQQIRRPPHPKWSKIRGFHTFRHSFASICAMKGIHPSIIDGWLGHQTEQMRRRYRHLFPEETHAARVTLFQPLAE